MFKTPRRAARTAPLAGRAAHAALYALAVAATLTTARAEPVGTSASQAPYPVSVWARVLFGPDGKPLEYALVNEEQYPVKFSENVRARVARAVIPPPTVEGRPVTLRTGVELRFEVTPTAEGGNVRLQGIGMGPMPVKQYLASYPEDIGQVGGWQGEASATCVVAKDGRCARIDVQALPGMPQSVRRYLQASLERWVFEPQFVDGQPIEGQFVLAVKFDTLDTAPEDFRQDKFLRALRGR
jgi:hypothetical protein